MRRVHVIGAAGTGKTTLARALARRLGVPAIDLDELFWKPGWQPSAPEEFAARVATARDDADRERGGWVCAGNYRATLPITLERADTVILLELPALQNAVRLVRRAVGRIRDGETVCNGNRETFAHTFLSRDSLLLYWLRNRRRHRREHRLVVEAARRRGQLGTILLTSREAAEWLASVPAKQDAQQAPLRRPSSQPSARWW